MSAFGGKADIGLRALQVHCVPPGARDERMVPYFNISPQGVCGGLVPRPEPANF
jgi:hypothetical protein